MPQHGLESRVQTRQNQVDLQRTYRRLLATGSRLAYQYIRDDIIRTTADHHRLSDGADQVEGPRLASRQQNLDRATRPPESQPGTPTEPELASAAPGSRRGNRLQGAPPVLLVSD